ncbi:hypothetical protein ACH4C6_34640 [Streptomyces sp. NPDC017943]|uniref:hypothetical protein n=1 Tax=Streptomyces sp. NPDC017943 TaxID=3365019 RepID=UPI003792D6CF
MPSTTPATAQATVFKVDDYVLYRDPAKFWAGEAGHTSVCRVVWVGRFSDGYRYNLLPVTGGLIRDVQGDYLRLLPPIDAMREIDTAPLNGEPGALTAGAAAWLTQQHALTEHQTAVLPEQHTSGNQPPELPEK